MGLEDTDFLENFEKHYLNKIVIFLFFNSYGRGYRVSLNTKSAVFCFM